MPSIECAICSEEFGKRNDDVIVTPCGHVFHEKCLSKWLQNGVSTAEPKTCPECRQSVTMSQTRRIYFNLSTTTDDVQHYIEYLNSEIQTRNNKLHMKAIELDKVKIDFDNKLRERHYEVEKLKTKINKLKSKVRESKMKHAVYPKVTVAPVMTLNENMGMHPPQFNPIDSINSMRMQSNMQPNNCDTTTSIFNPNLYAGQSSNSSTTIQNPFECDINPITASLRSIRNPLSTFTQSYQSQNGYMSANPMQAYSTMMNPIQSTHTTQTAQHQTISYNQTSFFLPIQATSSINATYYNANDQSHFIGQ